MPVVEVREEEMWKGTRGQGRGRNCLFGCWREAAVEAKVCGYDVERMGGKVGRVFQKLRVE